MNTHPDFEEFLRLLEKHKVDYMIVGGYAVAYHGLPRFTKDIDVFFNAVDENVTQLREALMEFGFCEQDLPEESFVTKGNILAFGVSPTRVDLINEIDGVTFDGAKPNIVVGRYGDVPVKFIGFDDLLKNKSATGRTRDKADIEELTCK